VFVSNRVLSQKIAFDDDEEEEEKVDDDDDDDKVEENDVMT
jgi:hypothetical protein